MPHTIEGTWEEIEARKAELKGHHLRVIIDPVEDDNDFGAPEHLIVRDEEHLKQLLQEGMESGPGDPVTEEYWAKLHQRIADSAARKNA
jgi:hypothetical protein